MPPQLSGVRGPLTGRTFALGDQLLTIGRASDNLVVIASPRASRHHAHIRETFACTGDIPDRGNTVYSLYRG